MKFDLRLLGKSLFAILILCPLVVAGQTLNLTNGIETYSGLTNTTVNLSGHAELHLTASSNPMPGCQINLNSPDAWLFLDNIQPSLVALAYLGQVRVNGAAAVQNSNVRVVEYGMGTVVIAQSPGYLPLEVFSGNQFTGTSMKLGLYTYDNSGNLGVLKGAISSFKLKRGYMATFAQHADGSGISRVYVAQDGDLNVGALPSDLNHSVGFIRVFPWRWTGKKGWAGGVQPLVHPLWSYDWNNAANSTLNTEYVPMRHDAYWNSYANINNKHDSTAALGFNEPDNSTANGGANMTVDQAIAQWPQLMASGLRLGSPAVTDGGLSWLYSFMDKADALHYRVDYVAVHFYRCGYTAQQLHDFLQAIHDRTHRPIWLTEFNNGANWTTCGVPTLQQNAQTIQSFISMLDNTPFVERYAIYNWVGDTRAMVDTNGNLTPAGVDYRDEQSPIGFVQDFPAGVGTEANYLFEGNALDRTGSGNDAMLVGAPSFVAGPSSGQAIQLDGVHDYVQMPANVGHGTNFTFAAWVKWNGGASWQRIFDLGAGTGQYLFLTPSSGSGTLRFAISTNSYSAEQRLETSALTPGEWTHVTVTINGTVGKLFVNGRRVAINSSMSLNPAVVRTQYDYLGKSQFPSDPLFSGELADVFFAGYALTDAQVAALPHTAPPQFTSQNITKPDAELGRAYADTLAGTATNAGSGTLTFSKVGGPAWLVVAANGGLSGVPTVSDLGTNRFTVRAVNSGGAVAVATLRIAVKSNAPEPANGGFELPVTSTYIYNPSGASWTFTSGSSGNGSGVTANASGFTAANASAPEGSQVAFLQGIASISQTFGPFVPGATYRVSFFASQRQNKSGGQAGQTFDVRVNNTVIGHFEPPQSVSGYQSYQTNFIAQGPSATLSFVGTDLHGGDNTVFLDDVQITTLPPPAFDSVSRRGDGDFQFNATGAPGTSYELQAATNMFPPVNWVPVTNAVADPNGRLHFTDLQATNFQRRFYRIKPGS